MRCGEPVLRCCCVVPERAAGDSIHVRTPAAEPRAVRDASGDRPLAETKSATLCGGAGGRGVVMHRCHSRTPTHSTGVASRRMDTEHAAAARYKLRQAEMLLAHLRTLPEKIALDLRRASPLMDHKLLLETYFFACLGAARSVFYILSQQGPQFKATESNWRNTALDQSARTFFHRMTDLRDDDVHYGEAAAEALGTMIPIKDDSMRVFHNAALFGPAPQAEHVTPDGSRVRAPGLQSTANLYIEVSGRRVEAAAACARYIEQLRGLIAATEVTP